MKSPLLVVYVAALLCAVTARVSAAPPATEADFPAFPASVLLSDEKNQLNPVMLMLNRAYTTDASADDVFKFYDTQLSTTPKKAYVVAATLAPGEVSGVAAMTGAVYGRGFLKSSTEEIRLAFSKRTKAAGADWVQGARFTWSSKDQGGGTRSFALEIMDQSITDDNPPHYRQKTRITLKVTTILKSSAGAEGSPAGLVQLGQQSQAQMAATQGAVEKVFAQDLFEPAKSGTPQQVLAALKAGGEIEGRSWGITPLMAAAATNPDPEVVSVLLKAGADVKSIATTGAVLYGATPLMHAAAWNTVEIVTALLRAGSDVKAEAELGLNSLWLSASNRHPGVVTALVKAGGDVHSRFVRMGQTPLLAAVEAGNPVALSELLTNGAGTDLKGPDGMLALTNAVTVRPQLEIISTLIKAGVDVNRKEPLLGSSALILAASAGVNDTRVYGLLLGLGARINDANQYGRTALMGAADACGNPEVLSVLLAAGADPKTKDVMGNTASSLARRNAKLEGADLKALDVSGAIDLFGIAHDGTPAEIAAALRNGCDPNTLDTTGYKMTPLMYAALSNRDAGVVAELLKAGATPNALDKLGRTALMLAAENTDNPEVVVALLAGGASVNIRDKMFKQTALMCAAINEKTPEIVGLLLKAGADPQPRDAGKQNARDYARKNKIFKGTPQLAELEKVTR
jgi:ankyrin repeat protein